MLILLLSAAHNRNSVVKVATFLLWALATVQNNNNNKCTHMIEYNLVINTEQTYCRVMSHLQDITKLCKGSEVDLVH